MGTKYTASRLSSGNKLFPPSISVEDGGLTVKFPALFSGKEKFVPFDDISSISYDTPMVGFTKLHLNIRGDLRVKKIFFIDLLLSSETVFNSRKQNYILERTISQKGKIIYEQHC